MKSCLVFAKAEFIPREILSYMLHAVSLAIFTPHAGLTVKAGVTFQPVFGNATSTACSCVVRRETESSNQTAKYDNHGNQSDSLFPIQSALCVLLSFVSSCIQPHLTIHRVESHILNWPPGVHSYDILFQTLGTATVLFDERNKTNGWDSRRHGLGFFSKKRILKNP